jgi:hypothetical protein
MFQHIWIANLLWEKVVIGVDGKLSMVWCKVCNVENIVRNFLFPNLMVHRNMLVVKRPSMHILRCVQGSTS